ncbi:glutathione S-transferase family protein [Candidatus Liberibacter americanus]|uniref:Glutathione-S-transferase n=1 Tax=Candidatus Liberibacter americanus str. Sao Paulo TaxID=1261131 RepID=U6B9E6_9HYPH|nr:glutathione S-transferase family protein [Candidatus Liberibacter americanus]AHA28342.1 Glutathione-S-transferase [Candidatus Liberibacter americanus str. Sao Paulo]EMS36632.1 glutathione S-transferase [Candidatus Liberibacter americanus PW_SP]
MSSLYHNPMSSSSRFIRLILHEYDFKPNMIEEFPWEKRRNFLEINPAGTLPVYVDDDNNIFCGSTVISEYINETQIDIKNNKNFLPSNSLQKAEIRRLVEWFLQKMEQDVTYPLLNERVYKLQMKVEQGGGSPDSTILRIARNNMQQHIKYMTWLIKSRSWIAGNHISYADFAAAASISTLDYIAEINWDSISVIKEWYQSIKSRPSFRPLLSERIRGLLPVSHYANLDF